MSKLEKTLALLQYAVTTADTAEREERPSVPVKPGLQKQCFPQTKVT